MQPNTPQVVPGQVPVNREEEVTEKIYYANLDGATYYFKDGKPARFENGVYRTSFPGEQEELDAMCGTPDIAEKTVLVDGKPVKQEAKKGRPRLAGNHMYFHFPVDVQRTDAHIMKEVAKSGTGMVSSAHLGQLSK